MVEAKVVGEQVRDARLEAVEPRERVIPDGKQDADAEPRPRDEVRQLAGERPGPSRARGRGSTPRSGRARAGDRTSSRSVQSCKCRSAGAFAGDRRRRVAPHGLDRVADASQATGTCPVQSRTTTTANSGCPRSRGSPGPAREGGAQRLHAGPALPHPARAVEDGQPRRRADSPRSPRAPRSRPKKRGRRGRSPRTG